MIIYGHQDKPFCNQKAWFDHFLTKLSIYLWIKAGDRHYHFVEPWVIDRPFCRMGTPLPPSEWEGGWFWTLLYGLGISMHFYAFLVLFPSNVGVLISTNKYIKHILER